MPRGRLILIVVVAVLAGFGATPASAAAVSFEVRTAGEFPFGEPWDLDYADFNDDGRLDVVVAAGEAGVHAFAGQPDGGLRQTFSASASFSTSVTSVAAPADVTGDGRHDMVYVRAGEVVVRAGDGAGGFGAESVTPLAQAIAVDTGDFDGDDRADVVVARLGTWVCCPGGGPTYSPPGGFTVLHGQSSGALSAGQALEFSGASVVEVRTGDVDGDQITDAVLATTSGFRVATGDATDGTPAGTLTIGDPFDGPVGGARLLLADFDDDGRDDIVTSRAMNNPDIFETKVRRSLVGGTLSAPVPIPGGFHFGMDWGDIDDDGLLDLVLDASYDGVRVAYGTGDGGFEDHTVYPVEAPGLTNIVRLVSVVVGDVNGDGVHDVVAGDAYSAHGRLLALRSAPFLTFESDVVDFGSATSGTTARRTLEIGNAGVADLNAEATDMTGAGFGLASDRCKGRPLPAGMICAVDLTFTPPFADAFEGSLWLESDDPEPLIEIFLEGVGVAPAVVKAPAGSPPAGSPPATPLPVTPVVPAPPSAARAAADGLDAARKAFGRRGLRRLARRRGVRFAFNAPAGTVQAALATRRRPGRRGRPAAILARAKVQAPNAGRLTVTLQPTAAGRRAARRARRVKAALRITVRPRDGAAARRSAAVTLRR